MTFLNLKIQGLSALGFSLLWATSLFLVSSNTINAQSQQLSDYAILAGDNGCAPGDNCGVIIGSGNTVNSGAIGSRNNVLISSCDSVFPITPLTLAYSSCPTAPASIISNASWQKSTSSLPDNGKSNWLGVASLPSSSTFTQTVLTGPSYPGVKGRPNVAGTQNIIAPNNITFYQNTFFISDATGVSAEFTMYFDDNVEVYINGHRLFRQQLSDYSTFTGVPHFLKINANGSITNGGVGYDAFDIVKPINLDTVLVKGVNTITMAVRNYSSPQNKGGFSVQLNLDKNGSPILLPSAITTTTGDAAQNLTHNGAIVASQGFYATGKNQFQGNVYVSNTSGSTDLALFAEANSTFSTDVIADGNIAIIPGAVNGKAIHPAGTNYYGPAPAGGEVFAPYPTIILPAFPSVSSFGTGGAGSIGTTQSISPGTHGSINLSGSKTITFNGVGDYILKNINNSGTNTFVFDFKNQATGEIQIFVEGTVNLGRIQTSIINGGGASRIFMEVHGTDASGTSWRMTPGAGSGNAEWKGTVWASYGDIIVAGGTSSAIINGALFSSGKVRLKNNTVVNHIPFDFCKNAFTVSATASDTLSCSKTTVTIAGSSTSTTGVPKWTTTNGNIISGVNSYSPVVSKKGIYTLTVTNSKGCVKSINVSVEGFQCIQPPIAPPDSGKTKDIIGSELSALSKDSTFQDTTASIFILQSDSVFIEVISIQGQYATLLALLQTPPYGLTKILNNGPNSLIISGLFPIRNLVKLDSLPNLINHVRPLYPPITLNGLAQTQGDAAMRADFTREAFEVYGEGVKIGVLSDSYNTKPGNPAQTDVSNEDLPGLGNPKNSTPVKVLKEYPFGVRSDEGRAMLQIIHDVAPKAELAFRTGYISPGDFAQGIEELQQDSCDIICDDITFITEPFLSDGQVAKAVNKVNALGVTYFSAAGNFGNKSYSSTFNPAPVPASLKGNAHDFGGGDRFQKISLQPGNYTIVLQWQDSIYSNGQTTGAKNDLDIYLSDEFGNTLFGFNRNNIGGDPLEILSFTVTQPTQSNLLIVRSSGNSNVLFKYVVFRGNLTIDEHQAGNSTIVGQANAAGAIAVGASRYDQTPAYGVNPPLIETFSSKGGTPINNVTRNKPELTGPNGVNTTVNLGAGDYEPDGLPNFFGTSAAAPHAAGVAALIMSSKKKFEGVNPTPTEVKNLMTSSAIDMGAPGFDFESGYGLIQAYATLQTLASPKPILYGLALADTTKTPGLDTVIVKVTGKYLTNKVAILLRNDTLKTNFVSDEEIEATVPPFIGNPGIRAYVEPITSSMLDGGFSDTIKFSTKPKVPVLLVMHNQVKKYSEDVPPLTFDVLVDSVPYDSAGYTLADLGLDTLRLFSTGDALSNIGIYLIRAEFPASIINSPRIVGFNELFNYTFKDAQLTINKMPLTITAKDTILIDGQKLGAFDFIYQYPDSLINPVNRATVLNTIEQDHIAAIADEVAVVDSRQVAGGRALVNADIERRTFVASGRALVNARELVSGRALVNGIPADTSNVVDVDVKNIYDYQLNPDSATLVHARPLVNARALVNVQALVRGRALVNGYPLVNAYPLINGYPLVNAYPLVNNQSTNTDSTEVIAIIDEEDADTTRSDTTISLTPINLITGTEVGTHSIVPAAFINNNYDVTYLLGVLNIISTVDTVTVVTDTSWRQSTSITLAGADQYPWLGNNGILPPVSSFSLPVVLGQPYRWHTMENVTGASVIKAPGTISYYRTTFNLSINSGRTARFRSYMDDGIEIYINGKWLAREQDRLPENYKGVSHDLFITSSGTYINGYQGGQIFDTVNQIPLDSVLVQGQNELIIVLRNKSGGDLGGLSFRMDLNYDTARIKKNSGFMVQNSSITEALDVLAFPNPTSGNLSVIPRNVAVGAGIQLQLFDLNGKMLVVENRATLGKNEAIDLDLSQLATGLYTLKVTSGKETILRKIIVY